MVRGLEKSHVLHQALWNINIPYTPYIPHTPPYLISHPKKKPKKIWWHEKNFVPLHPQSQIGRLASLL